MHVITFDTLEYTEQLKAAGVPEEHAKGHAKALALVIRQVDTRTDEQAAKHDKQVEDRFESLGERNEKQVQGRLDGLATKQEMDYRLAVLEANLKREVETIKAELQKEISVSVANAKTEIIKWVVGMGVVILGGMMTINRIFPPVPAYYQPPVQEQRQSVPTPAIPVPPAAPTPAQPH